MFKKFIKKFNNMRYDCYLDLAYRAEERGNKWVMNYWLNKYDKRHYD